MVLENFEDIIMKSGRKVGKQAEMIPLEHSIKHQVQALASVHGVSVGSNSNRVENR